MEMFEEGSLWNNESTKECNKSRKRKLDKDGFVVPNSPDRLSSHEDNMPLSVSMTERFKDINQETNEIRASDQLSAFRFSPPNDMPFQTTEERLPMGDGAASQETGEKMLHLLFEDFKLETASVFENWSRILSESEDFETKCPQKLDEMIDKSRLIDETLKGKKEIFKQRLAGLEQTLQM